MSDEEQKRLERFERLKPPEFSRGESEDAQDFLDRCWSTDAAPLTWQEFSVLFLEKLVPQTRIEELHKKFEHLHQEGMIVTQYEMRFADLARHAMLMLAPTERDNIMRFIDGLNYGLHYSMAREVATDARFISRRLEQVRMLEHGEREAKRPRDLGGFNSASSGGQSHYSRGRPSRLVDDI
ncbi:uncharacterized protein [Nicotiana tomentosiformis]|uniref:uncharacterized protein n=1 Tax=Nicotiana tomentosiformis TaxID=4098 RepID=UPI001446BADC|nr:uncharacterized protein LOC117277677 [Nicotiana tomentosiformis]